jgi:hypothetical protein
MWKNAGSSRHKREQTLRINPGLQSDKGCPTKDAMHATGPDYCCIMDSIPIRPAPIPKTIDTIMRMMLISIRTPKIVK